MSNCPLCQGLWQTKAFSSPEEYRAALSALTGEGYQPLGADSFQARYRCNSCGKVWLLASPDFPLRGYLLQQAP